MKHLIITTATISEDQCLKKLGYSYEQRVSDYQKSFDCALELKHKFDTIIIIETVSKEKVDFLENSGINVYYSNFDNSFTNKGINEMFHIKDFLENSKISDDDLIIKISGRYLMITDTILNIDSDFIAKKDGDIYYGDRGVHTFFFGFKKKLFIEFINLINVNDYDKCVEWLVKDYILSKNIKILENSVKLGVITCLYNKAANVWTRVLS
jgi:hypothetical protein